MKPDAVTGAAGELPSLTRWAEVLAGPDHDGPTILTADLDLDEVAAGGKFDFDVVGHYARPDVFPLVVNDSATPAVVRTTAEAVPSAVTGRACGAGRSSGYGCDELEVRGP